MDHDTRSLVRRRIDEFHEKHGGDCVDIEALGIRIYPDGAYRDLDPHGILAEPSPDLYKRAGLIVDYWEEKEARAIDAFEEYKERVEGLAELVQRERSAPAFPFSKDQAVAELTKLRDAVKTCQAKLRAARADLKKHEPPHLKQRAQRNAERRAQASDLLSATRRIQI